MPVFLLCPVLPSPAGMLKLGQRVGAFATRQPRPVTTPSRFSGVDRPPWHREAAARNPAPTHSWEDCAGPGAQCWVLNWFCLVS